MSLPIRSQGGHLVLPIGPKNINVVEDVEILLPFKFRWILFSGFRTEVINVSANYWQSWQFCFFPIGPKNTTFSEKAKILLPVKCPSSGFRREVENVSANQRPGRSSCFCDRPEKHNFGARHLNMLSVKCRRNPFGSCRGDVKNVKS